MTYFFFIRLPWLLKFQNIDKFCKYDIKKYSAEEKLNSSAHIKHFFQKSIIIWIIKHRNIGNICSTEVAMGTNLFFLKLSWTSKVTALYSITLYLPDGNPSNFQQMLLSERAFACM